MTKTADKTDDSFTACAIIVEGEGGGGGGGGIRDHREQQIVIQPIFDPVAKQTDLVYITINSP